MKHKELIQPFGHAAAQVRTDTYNDKENTIEVVFATETPVQRYNYDFGSFYEVLELSASACDLTRLNSGAPVLNTHQVSKLDHVIGVVVKAWIEPNKRQGVALLRLSGRPEVAGIVNDIKKGIICNISAGYSVTEFTQRKQVPEGETPTLHATQWTPNELSFVPVPADPNSGTRNEKGINQAEIRGIIKVAAPESSTGEDDRGLLLDERFRCNCIAKFASDYNLGHEFADEHIINGSSMDDVRAAASLKLF